MTHEPIQPQEAASNYKALPCPFCGKNPVVAAAGYATIYCVSDDCFGPKTTAEYLVDALVQWNTRASVPAAKMRPESPDRLTFCERCYGNFMHHYVETINGVAVYACNICHPATPIQSGDANNRSPAGIAEQPRLTDNDAGEISVTLDGRELRGWSYKDDTERRAKMFAAREYVEGWCDGRDA